MMVHAPTPPSAMYQPIHHNDSACRPTARDANRHRQLDGTAGRWRRDLRGLVTAALQQRGHAVYFWHENDNPPIAIRLPDSRPCHRAARLATAWTRRCGRSPPGSRMCLYVHGLRNPETEASTWVSGRLFPGARVLRHLYQRLEDVRLPHTRPCDREFGAACLLNYFPRRCGGLSALTMVAEYQRQSARLGNLRGCHAIVTLSEHMRREYLKHGFAGERVHCLPPVDAMHRGPASTVLAEGNAADGRRAGRSRPGD